MEKGWDEKQQSFIATMDGSSDDMDAALLLLAEVQFVDVHDPKFISTVEVRFPTVIRLIRIFLLDSKPTCLVQSQAIGRKLKRGPYLMRYTEHDDFGAPENVSLLLYQKLSQ
jgi:hypothetical protein